MGGASQGRTECAGSGRSMRRTPINPDSASHSNQVAPIGWSTPVDGPAGPSSASASASRERDPFFPGDVVALFQQIGSSSPAAYRTATTLTVALPHQFRHFSGLEGGVDADGRRGVPVPFAVLADDKPSTIRPLHDLGMVDLSQRPLQPASSCSPTAPPTATLPTAHAGCQDAGAVQFLATMPRTGDEAAGPRLREWAPADHEPLGGGFVFKFSRPENRCIDSETCVLQATDNLLHAVPVAGER